MAENGATKEAMRQAPLDVMVATFADRQAARDAYRTLRTMDKEGTISLGGAVVIDRNEMGKVHLEGAMLPGWLWGMIVVAGTLMLGMLGLVVWLGVLVVRGLRANMRQRSEGDYSEMREQQREDIRMATP